MLVQRAELSFMFIKYVIYTLLHLVIICRCIVVCVCIVAIDLSALGGMTALLELDASHNAINKLLAFTPPNCLKIVIMSHNKITEMTDMSAHHYLHHLELDGKYICEHSTMFL